MKERHLLKVFLDQQIRSALLGFRSAAMSLTEVLLWRPILKLDRLPSNVMSYSVMLLPSQSRLVLLYPASYEAVGTLQNG